jgi:hypothetical protein
MLFSLSTSDSIVLLGSTSTAVTALIAIGALFYARSQIQEAHRIAHGDFLLRLDEAFQRHDEVHTLLQPAFAWGRDGEGICKGGPATPEDWFKVTQYMGLLERVNSLLKNKTLELASADRFYGYRVYNLVSNDTIRMQKLQHPEIAPYWEDFIDLWLKIKPRHPDWRQYPTVVIVRKK